jgi:hypothetical protein
MWLVKCFCKIDKSSPTGHVETSLQVALYRAVTLWWQILCGLLGTWWSASSWSSEDPLWLFWPPRPLLPGRSDTILKLLQILHDLDDSGLVLFQTTRNFPGAESLSMKDQNACFIFSFDMFPVCERYLVRTTRSHFFTRIVMFFQTAPVIKLRNLTAFSGRSAVYPSISSLHVPPDHFHQRC